MTFAQHNRRQTRRIRSRRWQALNAAVHIAKKDLALDDATYRGVLRSNFMGVDSATFLDEGQLERLLRIFKAWGWQSSQAEGSGDPAQVQALRKRLMDMAAGIELGEARLAGLVKKQAGIDNLEWVHSIKTLERLLAAFTQIVKRDYA